MKRIKVALVAMLAAVVCTVGGCGVGAKAPYEAAVNKVFTCTDSYNGDMLVVNFDVTNQTKSYMTGYDVTYSVSATLDGVALQTAYMGSDNPNSINNEGQIGPKDTGVVQSVFSLPSGTTEGEVLVVISTHTEDYKKKVTVLEETIDLSEVEKVVSESDYVVSIDNKTVSDDSDGNPLLIVDMTFENNGTEATSFGMAIDVQAFQDGIELSNGYLGYRHPLRDDDLDEGSRTEIQPGKKIKVREVFELKDSKTEVEFTATDRYSFDKRAIAEEKIALNDTENYVATSDYKFDVTEVLLGYSKRDDAVVVVMVGEFTNNSDEEMSFSSALDIDARQAGMEMSSTYVPGAYENNSNKISPGTTITVAKAWYLNDADAEVKFKITDSYSYNNMEVFAHDYTVDELLENTINYAEAGEYSDGKVNEDKLKTL